MRPLLVTTVLLGLVQASQVYSKPPQSDARFTCYAAARSWCGFRVYHRPPSPGQRDFTMHSGATDLIPRLRVNHDVYCSCIGMRIPNNTCRIPGFTCKGPVPVQANNYSPRPAARD